ncbi:MAG: DUF2752 domain-containing protein [Gemmataceae bacterium]
MHQRLSYRQRLLVRAGLLLIGALALGGLVAVVITIPPTTEGIYPRCNFHRFTGLHCPGCGLTRCGYALLVGNIPQAAAYNIFGLVLFPMMAIYGTRFLWRWLWEIPPPRPPAIEKPGLPWSQIAVGVLLVFWVIRNIPGSPFELLAPHELAKPEAP